VEEKWNQCTCLSDTISSSAYNWSNFWRLLKTGSEEDKLEFGICSV
jgi:hypothetical protein